MSIKHHIVISETITVGLVVKKYVTVFTLKTFFSLTRINAK
jgi:hypothetical protein